MAADFIIKCKKTGIVFCNWYTTDIVISNVRSQAARQSDEASAQRVINTLLKPFYPSFDWHTVPADV